MESHTHFKFIQIGFTQSLTKLQCCTKENEIIVEQTRNLEAYGQLAQMCLCCYGYQRKKTFR